MTEPSIAHCRYRAAPDTLLRMREDPRAAEQEFEWPAVEDRFNWAHDWFNAIAQSRLHHADDERHSSALASDSHI